MESAGIPVDATAVEQVDEVSSGGVNGAAVPGIGSVLAPPGWLRNLGTSSWFLAGIALITVAAIALLSLTQTIVMPLVAASVVAAVMSPVVSWLVRHRIPRGISAALVLVSVVALAVGVVVLVVGGVLGQGDEITRELTSGRDTLVGWAQDVGVGADQAEKLKSSLTGAVKEIVPALLTGVVGGIAALSSLAFFLALTALSLFFLLKDGPAIRTWAERHAAVTEPVAHLMTGRALQSIRGYFVGVTVVAVFNAVVVGLGALLLDIPLPGTIALVTFLGAYIPYLGAWGAGAFAVLVALGGAGTDAAIGIAVVSLLANGLLQQLVQPVAYGAALGIHPLAVLIVTIAGGSLFGTVGLVLAPPLTSAITRIAADLAAARVEGAGAPAEVEALP